MPSPFPGMNPYLERPCVWRGFRRHFVVAASTAVVAQVRPKYISRLVPRIGRRLIDEIEGPRSSMIQIEDRRSREIVTMIDVCGPPHARSNGDDGPEGCPWFNLIDAPVHFVEIDLFRRGRPDCDYCVTVSRAEMRPRVELWPFRLRDRMPLVPVPLRAPDPDAVLDLQAVLDRVYDAAGYEDYIYAGEPVPPIAEGDRDWAAGLLAAGGPGEMPAVAS